MNCWEVLGIAPTDNEREIKRAYAKLLRDCHPEDEPEKFQRLNEAYQAALSYEFSESHNEDAILEQTGDDSNNDSFDKVQEDEEQGSQWIAEIEPVTEQEVYLKDKIEQFLASLTELLDNSRTDDGDWKALFNNELMQSSECRQLLSYQVFKLLAGHLCHSREDWSPSNLPDYVVPEFARIFDWQGQELELSKAFSLEEMDAVFYAAYGSAAINQKAEYIAPQENRTKRVIKFVAYAALWLFMLSIFTRFMSDKIEVEDENIESETVVIQQEPYWDADLEVCNQASEVGDSEAFLACLELAESGRVYAQMRVAGLYFDSEDKEAIIETYKWVSRASYYDESARLIKEIILLLYGKTEKDQEIGYKGIINLSDKGNAYATAYLATLYYLDMNVFPRAANPLWLLEKAQKANPDTVDLYKIALIHANGFEIKQNEEKAKELILQASLEEFPTGANNVAWELSTSSDQHLISTDKIVELAKSIIQDKRYAKDPVYVDTLAAAYAANKDFEHAIEYQKEAIELFKNKGYAQSEIEQAGERLGLFQQQKPAIYTSIFTDKKTFFNDIQSAIERKLLNQLHWATEQPE
ncbi:J domain-containing protein [Paraneptunicella aestuarii]|uniref:J domain-containing protein n=1 Tax=Paraneptunicella aestuarii TaxID=2831148 RepID=UPI001E52FBF7|nr:J domain-containing protein [Paraneptunicella aestuarii]UAA40619.1 J domain-containing protein [Paraneptunicella aestuarii]